MRNKASTMLQTRVTRYHINILQYWQSKYINTSYYSSNILKIVKYRTLTYLEGIIWKTTPKKDHILHLNVILLHYNTSLYHNLSQYIRCNKYKSIWQNTISLQFYCLLPNNHSLYRNVNAFNKSNSRNNEIHESTISTPSLDGNEVITGHQCWMLTLYWQVIAIPLHAKTSIEK